MIEEGNGGPAAVVFCLFDRILKHILTHICKHLRGHICGARSSEWFNSVLTGRSSCAGEPHNKSASAGFPSVLVDFNTLEFLD